MCIAMTIINAQTLEEALNYSNAENIGTARMLGAGGAFGALGGDQGAVLINPATIATFKKGEFAISPMNLTSNTTSSFNANRISDSNASNLHLFNMGAVFASSNNSSKWKSRNFGISYNKVSELDRNFVFAGESEGTIVERFAERANNLGLNELDPFEAGVAYDSDAIFDFENDLTYSFDPLVDQVLNRSQVVRNTGGISELAFSLGGNYKDQLHLGVSLGLPIVNYESTKTYSEEAPDDRSPFVSLEYRERLETSGTGINFKAGAIFTGIKSLRIGASIASPTRYNLNDKFSTEMDYSYINGETPVDKSAVSGEGTFEYTFSTPWKYTGSLAYIYKGSTVNGFLSADVDYLDYRNGVFDLSIQSGSSSDTELEMDLNNQINRELNGAINFRLGGEIAYDIYRLRLGYGLNASPYVKDDAYFSAISGGFGLRFDRFYFDLGARRQGFSQGYLPYVSLNEDNVQLVQLETTKTHIVSTFGIKF